MPKTTTVELRTSTVEQLADYLQEEPNPLKTAMTRERRDAVAARLRYQLE